MIDNNSVPNQEAILKEKKLIWKGTIKEGIEQGRFTQEDVDNWNREDEEGERYNEGFLAGKEAERKSNKEEILDLKRKLSEAQQNNSDEEYESVKLKQQLQSQKEKILEMIEEIEKPYLDSWDEWAEADCYHKLKEALKNKIESHSPQKVSIEGEGNE